MFIYTHTDGRFGNEVIIYWAGVILNNILNNTHSISLNIENISNRNFITINDYQWTMICHKYLLNTNLTNDYINELKTAYSKINQNVDDIPDLNTLKNNNIRLTEYYQRSEIYKTNIIRNIILNHMNESNNLNNIITKTNLSINNIMNFQTNDLPSNNELVVHFRLHNDFFSGYEVLNPKFYIDSIYGIYLLFKNIDTITFVVDKLVNNDDIYINHVKKNCPQSVNIKMHQKSLLEDFNYIKNAKYIISSNSTLSWTASYLSNAIIIVLADNKLSPHQKRQAIQEVDESNRCIIKDVSYFTRKDVDLL